MTAMAFIGIIYIAALYVASITILTDKDFKKHNK